MTTHGPRPGRSHRSFPLTERKRATNLSPVALPIGLLIGLSLGALGGGDSILTVPTLVHLLGQDTHAATTGSLLIVGVTVLAGMAAPLQSS